MQKHTVTKMCHDDGNDNDNDDGGGGNGGVQLRFMHSKHLQHRPALARSFGALEVT